MPSKMKPARRAVPRVIDATMRLTSTATPAPAPVAPPARGRLYYDYQIPDAFFGGLPKIGNKVRWVREHLPRATRIQIGRESAWYEADVLAYIATLQPGRASA